MLAYLCGHRKVNAASGTKGGTPLLSVWSLGSPYVCAIVNIDNVNRTSCSNPEANSVGRKIGREPIFSIFRDLRL